MQQYLDLMNKIIRDGFKKPDSYSLFGESLEFDLSRGFPLIESRKINYKAAFAELACFLKGYTDVRQFNKMGVNFWDNDCYKYSWNNNINKMHDHDLGKIYGFQWKYGFGFDQVEALINNIKKNKYSRRHVLITFNPRDLKAMCLPPCYVSHQVVIHDGKLNLLVHQRSADYCIGVPFDIASFALFQTLLAKDTGFKLGKLKIVFGDVHIYHEHLEGVSLQVQREEGLPSVLKLKSEASLLNFTPDMASIEMYRPQTSIKYLFITQA